MDAAVVGSGPNGLAAAIVLAQAGLKVVVHEAAATAGGGLHSSELTLPGFVHDVCSAVHPFALVSPFFTSLPLKQHGLDWIEPPVQLAHPFDEGAAAVIYRSLDRTARDLGRDERGYRRTIGWTAENWPKLSDGLLGPLRFPAHPWAMAAFGLSALDSIDRVSSRAFRTGEARALVAGIAAHGMLSFDTRPSAGVALTLGALAHVAGWVIPRGGAQRVTDALVAHLRSLGGEVRVNSRVTSVDDLAPARVIMCDVSPRPFLAIAGHRLPEPYKEKLQRYRYGMGVFKVDWALDAPIPWRAEACAKAATVHLGGSYEELAASERDAWQGRTNERPFVIITQPSLFDDSRAPRGSHTAWGYCHVPHGSTADMLPVIERQVERFAPGFARHVVARHVLMPADLERMNANLVGGDIASGVTDLAQLFTRPTRSTYSTPVKGLYLCSAATPPGVGVHGMCGYHAARKALNDLKVRAYSPA
ncbi:MAG TPA: NAD(P)/FAD-dependent oxidoreductase [Vicinamibacterales bacterium]|jgi:phytoene dehydrogenase-like protein|nr:NAD(P)/FAD-dependent oxidoreductase [Vicinamibacterales bacterium]